MREQFSTKGFPTCDEQVTSEVRNEATRNSTTNAWYCNTSNGNRNNNNSYNRYHVTGSSDFIENCNEGLHAESKAYKHKHHDFDACRIHYHIPELYKFIIEVNEGRYAPRPMKAFVLSYPVFREAFAPNYLDCILHGFISPLFTQVAEKLHESNGDISHGNRIGHSAQKMAEKIQKDIAIISENYTTSCIRVHRDLTGFFVSINRLKAYKIVEKLSKIYYNYPDREDKLKLLKITLLSDPTKDCIMKSPQGMGEKYIEPRKSLFNAKPNHGVPIGRYPSQVIAGIYLGVIDRELIKFPNILIEHFVDDYDFIATSMENIIPVVDKMKELLESLDLSFHKNKISVQSVYNGLLSCGRVVKRNRIYISNRTIKNCKSNIKALPKTLRSVSFLYKSINSIFGLMKHCNNFNIQKQLTLEVELKFGKWLYFKQKQNQFVCKLKEKYTDKCKARKELENLLNTYLYDSRKIYKRNFHTSKSRKRKRNNSKEK